MTSRIEKMLSINKRTSFAETGKEGKMGRHKEPRLHNVLETENEQEGSREASVNVAWPGYEAYGGPASGAHLLKYRRFRSS